MYATIAPGRSRRRLGALTALALALGGAVLASAPAGAAHRGAADRGAAPARTARRAGSVPLPDDVFVHDPSMIGQGGTWYLYSTGDPNGGVNDGDIQIRESKDLKRWRLVGTVFKVIPSWITTRLGSIPNLWAPDISYFDGRYHLYYAASSFGSNDSIIALATNTTLDPAAKGYQWRDDGEVFSSNDTDDYNAIDPALVSGAAGSKWLLFGSFWSGIKLVALDPSTGKPRSSHPRLYPLSEAPAPDPEEGAYLIPHGGFYYLFVSRGACCRGIGSTYQVIVGRSRKLTGPYLDPEGTAMTSGGGMELLGSTQAMIGPGSGSIDVGRGGDLFDYHYYDAWDAGDPWIQVRRLLWTASGWPVTGPPIVPVPGAPLG